MAKKNSGKSVKQVPIQFDRAEIPEDMSKQLIAKYHEHLINAKIAYLYKNKPIVKGGRLVIATAEKCNPKTKALCTYSEEGESFDFIITISYKAWNNLSDSQKLAVLDHELSHCMVSDDEKTGEPLFQLISHDFEDFYSVIKRNKLYSKDLETLVSVIKNS